MAQLPQQHREGEVGHFPYRSERIYFSGNAWYFLIRGGHSKGPYNSVEDAKLALKGYIDTLANLHKAFHKPTEHDHHTDDEQKKSTTH